MEGGLFSCIDFSPRFTHPQFQRRKEGDDGETKEANRE